MPRRRRSSVSACRPVSSTASRGGTARSGWSGNCIRAAPACTVMTLTLCAITSCNSRAIRPRSVAAAAGRAAPGPAQFEGTRLGGCGAAATARQQQGEQPGQAAKQCTVDRLLDANPDIHDGNDRDRAQPESQTGDSQLTIVPLANGPEGEQYRDRPGVQAADSLRVGERDRDVDAEHESRGDEGEAAAQQQRERVQQDPRKQQPARSGDLAEQQLDFGHHGDGNDENVKPAFRHHPSW